MSNLTDYAVPVLAFVFFLLSDWEDIWQRPAEPAGESTAGAADLSPTARPSHAVRSKFAVLFAGFKFRGLLMLLVAGATLGLGFVQYSNSQQESKELIERIALESRRLRPDDFVLQLEATGQISAPSTTQSAGVNSKSYEVTRLSAYISNAAESGGVSLDGEWRQFKPPMQYVTRNPHVHLVYVSSAISVTGLEAFPYLDSLSETKVRVFIPRREIETALRKWKYTLHVIIRGHKLSAEVPPYTDLIELTIPKGFPNERVTQ
jgi:hypothetical protein